MLSWCSAAQQQHQHINRPCQGHGDKTCYAKDAACKALHRVHNGMLCCCLSFCALKGIAQTATPHTRSLKQADMTCPAGCHPSGCIVDSTAGGYKCTYCQGSLLLNAADGVCTCPGKSVCFATAFCGDKRLMLRCHSLRLGLSHNCLAAMTVNYHYLWCCIHVSAQAHCS